MAHEQSPLTLLSHRFISFSCEVSREKNPAGSLALNTEQTVSQHTEEAQRWMVELEVSFKADDPKTPSPYSGKITVQGHFLVQEEFKERHHEALIRVTGSSMLYGACREMLANFTARSTHGILSLPSISFREKKEEDKVTTA
jgi:preprotein translocase subunit SecB